MAIKNLFLVAATLCFLVVAVTAQQRSEPPLIIANGTVSCSNNATADYESVAVEVILEGDRLRYEFADSTGQFTIDVPSYRFNTDRIIYPNEIHVEIIAAEEVEEEVCPGGTLMLEDVNVAARFGNYYVGNRILANGTRVEFYQRV